jgi:type VI secretion system protein ImpC
MQFSPGNVNFELTTSFKPAPQKVRDDTPFRIAILADFSGRSNRGLCEAGVSLAGRRRTPVDLDNFEKLPAKLGAEIHIPIGDKDGPRLAVRFGELDDFHPDRIFERVEAFQKLKLTRKRLQDPASFGQAASQVRSWATGQTTSSTSKAEQAEDNSTESKETNADAIERLLGKRPSHKPVSQFVDVDRLIREMVKPYIVPAPDPQQAELVGQVDEAISGQMRAIMHHQDFQSLESAWRTLHFLVSRVETDETLKLYLVDISKEELAADLAPANQLQSTGTYRFLVEQSVGVQDAEPWAMLVGGYTFDQTEKDVALLGRLAQVAQATGAPFLAEAGPHFARCESFAAAPGPDDWQWEPDPAVAVRWQQLRRSPEAAFIGLALPRFLLRLPYGKDTDPTERFDFEEQLHTGDHEEYLWGNPAAVCACLFAEAFREFGWSLTGGLGQDMVGLPMHVYESDGERHVTPCAEAFLTDRAMDSLIDKGLIPLLSIKGRDAVRLARFQSIAEPAAPLAGPWR